MAWDGGLVSLLVDWYNRLFKLPFVSETFFFHSFWYDGMNMWIVSQDVDNYERFQAY